MSCLVIKEEPGRGLPGRICSFLMEGNRANSLEAPGVYE